MLPARAGMSPKGEETLDSIQRAPRTGGDEPHAGASGLTQFMCSPHGRG